MAVADGACAPPPQVSLAPVAGHLASGGGLRDGARVRLPPPVLVAASLAAALAGCGGLRSAPPAPAPAAGACVPPSRWVPTTRREPGSGPAIPLKGFVTPWPR